jgi:hypothetical protein
MSVLYRVYLEDSNGDKSSVAFYTADTTTGDAAVHALDAITNAQIINITVSEPVALQALTNNDAVAANVETARAKAKVRLRGADSGSMAKPFAYTTISIPAPIGTLINGPAGDVTNSELQALMGHVLSATGVQMTVVESVKYGKGK